MEIQLGIQPSAGEALRFIPSGGGPGPADAVPARPSRAALGPGCGEGAVGAGDGWGAGWGFGGGFWSVFLGAK